MAPLFVNGNFMRTRLNIFPLLLLFVALQVMVSCPSAFAGEIKGLKASASSFKEWGVPGFLVDGDLTTAWVGGRKGIGPGKKLSFELPKARKISMVRIANGNQGDGLFADFRCMVSGILLLPDHAAYFFTLKPEAGEQDIIFPPVTVRSFEIVIAEVHPAADDTEFGDAKVAVSEVRVFSDAKGKATVASIDSSQIRTASVKTAPPAAKPKAPEVKGRRSEMPYFSATKPGAIYLRASVPASGGVSMDAGIVNELVGEEFVDLVRGYFRQLVTLDDGYLNVFASSIRLRELESFVILQDDMRSRKLFDSLHTAEVNTLGLSMDKPIIRGDAAMLRVHGACQYTMPGRTFEFPVDAMFSFVRSNGVWLINGVQNRLK